MIPVVLTLASVLVASAQIASTIPYEDAGESAAFERNAAEAAVPLVNPAYDGTSPPAPPPVAREFRGVWIASVANIDWPSRRGLSTWEQQRELVAILDRAVALNLNAVIFQVRPAADALYQSSLEPWSGFLTGRMGVAPNPFYDPLAFAIEESHKRGLELHAWFNPYRARHPSDTGGVAASHISVRKPALVKPYGSFTWMDPGEPEVRAQTVAVVLDVVRRYDVDGIHIDDYFYPYQERDKRGRLIPFPDDASWRRYRTAGGRLSRDDWRRENVDRLVSDLYEVIHREKPWVKFGVSPFGIWRPGNPPGVMGLDAYREIYADALKWLRNGWLDYIAPQLYWRADSPAQPFDRLLAWWTEQNVRDRHVWPGLFTSKSDSIETNSRWRASEVLEQVRLTREQPASTGHIHFSMRALMQSYDSIADHLRSAYAEPALVPAANGTRHGPPAIPQAEIVRDPATGALSLTLFADRNNPVWLWTVRARYGDEWRKVVLPARLGTYALTRTAHELAPDEIVLTAVDRSSNESGALRLSVPPRPSVPVDVQVDPLAELAEEAAQ